MKQTVITQSYIKWAMVILVVVLAGCQAVTAPIANVQGSGTIISETRPINGFSQIEIYMGADLTLTQGDTENLTIEADDNLMPYILTSVRNGTLVIEHPANTNLESATPIQVRVGFRSLRDISVFGRSAITADDLQLNALSITFNGSGSTRLTGRVDQQEISIRGRADLFNFDLTGREIQLEISGTGRAEVNATERLDVTVAGMGIVHYRGDPVVTRNVSGTATIEHQS
jgi:hypothetical protein